MRSTSPYTGYDDAALLARMAQDDKRAFDELYNRHLHDAIGYVYNRLQDREKSIELAQEFFLSLWSKRGTVTITVFRHFLFTALKFRVINTMRDKRVRKKYEEHFHAFNAHSQYDNSNVEHQNLKDLERSLERSLAALPENYRTAFHLSRYKHLQIREIAEHLKVSPRTAEGYLTKTLKHLRTSLGEFLAVVWWLDSL